MDKFYNGEKYEVNSNGIWVNENGEDLKIKYYHKWIEDSIKDLQIELTKTQNKLIEMYDRAEKEGMLK